MPQEKRKLKSSQKLKPKQHLSIHSVNDAIPIDKADIASAELSNGAHVIVWQLYESPTGELEATEIFAGSFHARGFPASFSPKRPGHYQIFLAHYDDTQKTMHVYSQGPHGVRP